MGKNKFFSIKRFSEEEILNALPSDYYISRAAKQQYPTHPLQQERERSELRQAFIRGQIEIINRIRDYMQGAPVPESIPIDDESNDIPEYERILKDGSIKDEDKLTKLEDILETVTEMETFMYLRLQIEMIMDRVDMKRNLEKSRQYNRAFSEF